MYSSTGKQSIWEQLTDFLLPSAHAQSDEIRATISAADSSGKGDGIFTPDTEEKSADESDQVYRNSTAGSAKDEQKSQVKAMASMASSESISVGGGSGGVNSVMGSYGYSYPIEAPPGRGGFAPDLALSYSSMQGNGWLGVGWALSVGYISRSLKNGKPKYTDEDTFVINLKGTSIPLVREGEEFRLKDEGLFLRIRKSGEGWWVTDKGGASYYFGTTNESRQMAPGDGIYKWCLDKMVDPNGNAILYSYETDEPNNQIYLKEISYDVDNYIVFQSETDERYDTVPSYSTHFRVVTAKYLSQIKVYNGGKSRKNLVRRYAISWKDTKLTKESMIRKITMYVNGAGMPPTVFKPVASQSNLNKKFKRERRTSLPHRQNARMHMGDFTGDGKTDYVETPRTGDGKTWTLYKRIGSSFIKAAEGTGIGRHHKVLVADYNGDGKADILTHRNRFMNSVAVELYLSTGEGFDYKGTVFKIQRQKGMGKNLYIGDFNGDRKADILTRYAEEIAESEDAWSVVGWSLYISNGDSFTLAQKDSFIGNHNLPGSIKNHSIVLGDFNGDGMTDAIMKPDLHRDDKNKVVEWGLYRSNGKTLELVRQADEHEGPSFKRYDRLFAGDYNSDGMTDIVVTGSSYTRSTKWNGYKLLLSTGDDFILSEKNDSDNLRSFHSRRIYPGDYNGDGRTDILVGLGGPGKVKSRRLLLSNGSGLVRGHGIGNGPPAQTLKNEQLYLGDFNANGRSDLIVSGTNGAKLFLARIDKYQTFPQKLPRLMGKITSMLGGTTTISYRPSSFWPKDIDKNKKYNDMPMVVPTTSKIFIHDPSRSPEGFGHKTRYFYEGGLYDIEDREFRGFGKVTVKSGPYMVTVANYYHQDPVFQGRIAKSLSYIEGAKSSEPDRMILSTVNTYDAHVYTSSGENERTFAFVKENSTTKYDEQGREMATVTAKYTYDNFGNMLTEDKTDKNHETGETIKYFTRSDFNKDIDRWIVNKPKFIRTGASDPGVPGSGTGVADLRQTTMEYYDDRPWLLRSNSQKVWKDVNGVMVDTGDITINYDYDSYGNNTWVSNPRNPSWGVKTDYSLSDGMFPNVTEDALGGTIKREFDSKFGAVTEEIIYPKFSSKQKTVTQYDLFGRPKTVTNADGSTKTFYYHVKSGEHYVKVESSLLPTITHYYDNLDRVRKTEVKGGDRTVFTDTVYKSNGKLVKKSLPYDAGTKPEYIRYKYDERGRTSFEHYPDGTSIERRYYGFSETIIDQEGHQKSITKDGLGRLISVKEATGKTTHYGYDLYDNLTKIIDPLGNQTKMQYDSASRKVAMDDPYSGHFDYDYDKAGNLVWQRDNEQQVVSMMYDELNRLTQKDYEASGRRITYTYGKKHITSDQGDETYFNKGQLVEVRAMETDGFVSSIEYNYNVMGHHIEENFNFIGSANTAQVYKTKRTYDLAGRLDTLSYHDKAKIDYDYHPMGYLQEVFKIEKDNSRTSLAEYGDHTAAGKVRTIAFGNGTTTQYTYWQGNQRLKTLQTYGKLTSTSQFGLIQNLSYTFDKNGNLENISDQFHNADYAFGYDSLSRLTSAIATCNSDKDREYNQVYTYDVIGNMIKKTGKAGFEVIEWEGGEHHIRPTAVLFDKDFVGAGDREVEYNQDNKPTRITYNNEKTTFLVYDGLGNRIKKISDGDEILYVGGLFEIRDNTVFTHVYANGQRIVTLKDSDPYYTHTDHLGSSSLVTSAQGVVIEEIGYLPFGFKLFGKAYNNGSWQSVYTFTGQEFDEEYELLNFNARLYDPVLARFITADTVVPDWTNPQSLNRYSYCLNNPLKYVDPSGHEFTIGGLLVAALWGLLIGGAVGGIMALKNGGNVWEGITKGAVSGAVSGAMFYCAGSFISSKMFASFSINQEAAKAAVHTVTGASSGAVNAAISGGDIGRGAFIGALSAGMAKGIGELANAPLGSIQDAATRVGTGSLTGGIASVIHGGDFADGALEGAWASAIAYICNDLSKDHEVRKLSNKKYRPIFKGGKLHGYVRIKVKSPTFSDVIGDFWDKIKSHYTVSWEERIAMTEDYLQSDVVQGKFATYTSLATASPLNLLGIKFDYLPLEQSYDHTGSAFSAVVINTGKALRMAKIR